MSNDEFILAEAKFYEKYQNFSEREVLLELLFAQQLQIYKLDYIRGNTSKLVWWLVAIPITIFIFALVFSVFSGAAFLNGYNY